jgi:hypothetical protein
MSTAKNFLMIGVSDLYTEDHDEFAKRIGQKLQTNITMVFIYDPETEKASSKIESKTLSFGYKTQTNIKVEFYKYDKYTIKEYTVALPIDHYFDADKILDLDFLPNGLVQGILPNRFLGSWTGLIDGLKGKLPEYTQEAFVSDFVKERETYRKELRSIGIKNIVYYPDGYFDFDYCEDFPKVGTSKELLTLIRESVNVQIFDLVETIRQSHEMNLDKTFIRADSSKTIFIDSLEPLS